MHPQPHLARCPSCFCTVQGSPRPQSLCLDCLPGSPPHSFTSSQVSFCILLSLHCPKQACPGRPEQGSPGATALQHHAPSALAPCPGMEGVLGGHCHAQKADRVGLAHTELVSAGCLRRGVRGGPLATLGFAPKGLEPGAPPLTTSTPSFVTAARGHAIWEVWFGVLWLPVRSADVLLQVTALPSPRSHCSHRMESHGQGSTRTELPFPEITPCLSGPRSPLVSRPSPATSCGLCNSCGFSLRPPH